MPHIESIYKHLGFHLKVPTNSYRYFKYTHGTGGFPLGFDRGIQQSAPSVQYSVHDSKELRPANYKHDKTNDLRTQINVNTPSKSFSQ